MTRRSIGLAATIIATVALESMAAASTRSYVGTWEYEDATSYTGLSLKGDGRCMMFGVEKGEKGKIGAAIGTKCRFIRDANKVTIVEYSDETATTKADPPLELKYIPTRDVVEMGYLGKPIALLRTQKFKYFTGFEK
jgi:hypothetical protein